MSVTVFTTPFCVQCEQTKKVFTKNSIEFSTVDVSQDEVALEMIKTLGYSAAPVVIAGDSHWSGFRPDMIALLVKSLAA